MPFRRNNKEIVSHQAAAIMWDEFSMPSLSSLYFIFVLSHVCVCVENFILRCGRGWPLRYAGLICKSSGGSDGRRKLCFAWIITGNELIARAIYMLCGAAAFCVFTLLERSCCMRASVLSTDFGLDSSGLKRTRET
jgi:hypothetical protein